MKLGYQKGMISLYDIGNVAMLYEPANYKKVFEKFNTLITEAENTPVYHQYFNNLKYLVHISKAIVSIKNGNTNYAVRVFLIHYIKDNFNEKYSYDWEELKSILFYCTYFANLESFKIFVQILKNPLFKSRLSLYLLSDRSMVERKALAQ